MLRRESYRANLAAPESLPRGGALHCTHIRPTTCSHARLLPFQEEHRLTLLNMTTGEFANLFDDDDDEEEEEDNERPQRNDNNTNDDGRGVSRSDLDRPSDDGHGGEAPARQPHRQSSMGDGGPSAKHKEYEPRGDGHSGDEPGTSATAESRPRPPALLVETSNAYPGRGGGGGRHGAPEQPSRMRKSSLSRSRGQHESAAIVTDDAKKKRDEPRPGRDSRGGTVGGRGENDENEAAEAAERDDVEGGAADDAEGGGREDSSDEAEENGGSVRRRSSGDGQHLRSKGFGPIVMNCSQVRLVCDSYRCRCPS